MKRTLFTLAVFLLALGMSAGADESEISKPDNPASAAGNMAKKIVLGDRDIWYGYWNGVIDENTVGTGAPASMTKPVHYEVAIYLPPERRLTVTEEIGGLKFTFPTTQNIQNVEIWIAEDNNGLPGNKIMTKYVLDIVGMDNPENPLNEVFFPGGGYSTPSDKGVFVGYSFDMPAGVSHGKPVVVQKTPDYDYGLYLFQTDPFPIPEWRNYSRNNIGHAAIQVLLYNAKATVNLEPGGPELFTTANAMFDIPVPVFNRYSGGYRSVAGVVEIDGVKTPFDVVLPEIITEIGVSPVNIPVKAPSRTGVYEYKVTLEKANGYPVDNRYNDNVCTGKLNVRPRLIEKKVVYEYFTSFTDDKYPRALVDIQKLQQLYGDRIIPVFVHHDDELECSDYDDFLWHNPDLMGFALIDRVFPKAEPYRGYDIYADFVFKMNEVVEPRAKISAVADISVQPEIHDKVVTANANVRFVFGGDASKYAVGFILTENGMSNPDWVQFNENLSGNRGWADIEPLLAPWIDAPVDVKGLKYDNIVIASAGTGKGIEGSIPATVEEEVPVTCSHDFNLRDYPKFINGDNLYVTAILYNTETGEVVNADRKRLPGPTGVEESVIDENAVEIARYTVDGRRISQPVPGINIVRYSDGRVEKVFVGE